eukprot:scaffold16664_cov60-Phaeocystis_antarctica.AAC.2
MAHRNCLTTWTKVSVRAVLEASARNPVCRSARLPSSIKAKTAWHLGQHSSKECAPSTMSQGPQPKLTPNI